jgi:hypothetical protein
VVRAEAAARLRLRRLSAERSSTALTERFRAPAAAPITPVSGRYLPHGGQGRKAGVPYDGAPVLGARLSSIRAWGRGDNGNTPPLHGGVRGSIPLASTDRKALLIRVSRRPSSAGRCGPRSSPGRLASPRDRRSRSSQLASGAPGRRTKIGRLPPGAIGREPAGASSPASSLRDARRRPSRDRPGTFEPSLSREVLLAGQWRVPEGLPEDADRPRRGAASGVVRGSARRVDEPS